MLYADRIRQQLQTLGSFPQQSPEQSTQQLPLPSDIAIDHSEKLYQHIKQQINSNENLSTELTFKQLMQQLLYQPGLGYYSAGSAKIGEEGDFITAPEISAYFGYAIAKQCAQVLMETQGSILEFGAGLGTLARDVLTQLESDKCLPEQYFILEVSADLKLRQQEFLQKEIPHLFSRITWLDALSTEEFKGDFNGGFKGVILANEVLDAMPVHLFEMRDTISYEMCVTLDANDDFELYPTANLSTELNQWFKNPEIEELFSKERLQNEYLSEVNLEMQGWIKALADSLGQGLVLLIDYGYPRHEYYHPDRNQGTLMCHYRHHSHDQALLLAGLQDITAHVDFTAVAELAVDNDLSVSGYTNQAGFLTGCGILQLAELAADGDATKQIKIAAQIRKLIMPEEMGELFKVIALTKELPHQLSSNLIGFALSDLRRFL